MMKSSDQNQMASSERSKRVKICEICGSTGKSEKLVTCFHCQMVSEHSYCMRNVLVEVPGLWYCEKCLTSVNKVDDSSHFRISKISNRGSHVLNDTRSPGNHEAQKHSGGSSKILDNCFNRTAAVVGSSSSQHVRKPLSQCVSSKVFKAPKTKFLPLEEVLLKSGARSTTHGRLGVSFHRNDKEKKSQCFTSGPASEAFKVLTQANKVSINSDGQISSEKFMRTSNDNDSQVERMKHSEAAFHSKSELKKIGFQEMDIPLVLIPTPHICWMGKFDVSDLVSHDYGGIQAQFPAQICLKVYDISKHMPETLNLKVLERNKVWPQMFQLDPPNESDIGLYFFPCEANRNKEKYIRLLERLDSRDQAMQGWVNDVELLVFVSKQLPEDSQRIDGSHYLWAIFHHLKPKQLFQKTEVKSPLNNGATAIRSYNCSQLNVSSQRNNGEVDILQDEAVDRTGKSSRSFDTPCGFPKVRNPDGEKHSAVKFPLDKVADPIDLDNPPGFSKLNSPSYSSAATISRCSPAQLNVPSQRNHREVEIARDKVTGRAGTSTLSFDTPGFSEVKNPNCEKRSAYKFHPENVADLTDADIPPGFSKLDHRSNSSAAMSNYGVSQLNVLSRRNHKEVGTVWNKETDRTHRCIPLASGIPPPPGFPDLKSSKHHHSSHVSSLPENADALTNSKPHKVHLNCPEASRDQPEFGEHPRSNHPVHSEKLNKRTNSFNPAESGSEPYPAGKNLPSSAKEKVYPSRKWSPSSAVMKMNSDVWSSQVDTEGIEKTDIECKMISQNRQIVPCSSAAGMRNVRSQYNVKSENSSEETEMEIDMKGGEEIGRIDIPIPRVGSRPDLHESDARDLNHAKRTKGIQNGFSGLGSSNFLQLPSVKERRCIFD